MWRLGLTATLLAISTLHAASVTPQDRISGTIDEAVKVSLPASLYPALAQATSSLPADPALNLNHIILTLQPTTLQQQALAQLIAQQADPKSPQYHKFLTPAEYGSEFGASASDVAKIVAWLASKGFRVERTMPSNLAIVFSGTAAQVNAAFGAAMRQYVVNGASHYANANAIQIPAALAPVVSGLVKLNDFHSTPSQVKPQATYGSTHYLAPADFATIYDLSPLYSAGVNGLGGSIALVGRSNIMLSDIANFQAQYGLPANVPTVVLATGADPGFTGDGDALEATLDVEWSGAIAPEASISLVIAASTAATDGVDLAAQYAVNNSVADVLSVSFGSCEAQTNNAFYNNLWQQAAAQGITVFVSAGDSGAAGCQNATATNGTARAVNGICSSPYSTCVGGTEFNEGSNPGQYWLPGNNSVLGSAISYIPEEVWNESGLVPGGSNLYAGGGGTSMVFPRPAWQAGLGVPTTGQRFVPDVSLTAASHDGYLVTYEGLEATVSGTSASSPSMAGIMALVVQQNGVQGLANPNFYAMAELQANGGPAAFHDITAGNNSVPGLPGFAATVGYDEASGLGSVDGQVLVNNWSSAANSFTLALSSAAIPATPASPGTITITAAATGAFNSNLTLSYSTLPAAVTASFTSTVISGATGTSTLSFTIGKTAITGVYPITVTASGGGLTKTVTFDLDVTVATTCTLAAAPASISMVQGYGSTTGLTCGNAQGVFDSSMTLSLTGLVSGMTASFSPATLLVGAGVTKLTVNASNAVAAGTYSLTVTATLRNASPVFSVSLVVPVVVNAPTTFTLAPSATTVTFAQGASTSFTVTSAPSGSFNGLINFSLSGLPPGMTGTLSAPSVAAPGNGTITVSLSSLITTATGTYTALITAYSGVTFNGGYVDTLPIKVVVTAAPTFVLTSSQKTLAISTNATPATIGLTVGTLANGFSSAVTFATAGLPAGVTATFTPSSLAAPGSGSTVLSLSAASTATTGVVMVQLTATGGTLVRTVLLQLTVAPAPTFTLTASLPSYNLVAGDSVKELISANALYQYTGTVALSTSALPAGLSVVFSSTTMSGAYGTSTMTVQTASSLAVGTYSITVTATDSVHSITQSTTISLLVGTVTAALNPTSVSLLLNGSATSTVTTVATSYTGNIYFYLTSLPAGITYSFSSPNVTGSATSTLTIYAAGSANIGTYTVYLHTQTGGVFSLTPLTISIP
jgi:subtilase family serine protease